MEFKKLFCTVTASVGLTIGVANAAPLPLDVLDTADVNYTSYLSDCGGGIGCITDATSLGDGGGPDHFDDAFGISLNGLGYSPTEGTAGPGTSLSLEALSLAGFEVSVSFQTTGPVIRQLVTITNTGANSANASVQWHNNTGNDGAQQVIATSDGDLLAENSDQFVVTADSLTGTNNEVNAWIYQDATSLAPTSVDLVDGAADFGFVGEEGFNAVFDLVLAAGEMQSLLFFAIIEGVNDDGIMGAANFSANEFVADLSAATLSQVQNFSFGQVSDVPLPAAAWLFLAGLGALGAGRKQRRLQK